MTTLESLRQALPEPAKDIKLNLGAVLEGGTLTAAQHWGTAVAAAIAVRDPELRDALTAAASGLVSPAVLDDARAAAALMAMTNVLYRFRHQVGKPEYASKPARLRMNRLIRPAASKVDFELFCLAVSTLNGCEICVRGHEEAVLKGGLTEDHVLDAVRIAATIHATAVARSIGDLGDAALPLAAAPG